MIADNYRGGPVGVEAWRRLSEPRDTVEDIIDPF